MRKDISKVLTLTGRAGGQFETYKYKRRRRRQQDPESSPKKEGMRRPYSYDRKMFDEYFPPLVGFLRKSVGRRWDDVYSEIRENLNLKTATQYHVWQHIYDFVEKDPIFIDGIPHSLWYLADPRELRDGELYVDAKGFLRAHRQKKQPKAEKPLTSIKVDDSTYYEKEKGIWYMVRRDVRRWPRQKWVQWHGERKLMFVHDSDGNQVYNEEEYVAEKRQLNSKELKKLGLENG